jgi:pSer/pThr/pTyr-binding forkhead associated (FHA) protein
VKTKVFLFISLGLLLNFIGINARHKSVRVDDILTYFSDGSEVVVHFGNTVTQNTEYMKSITGFIPSLILYPDKVSIEEWVTNNLLIVVIGGSAIFLLILVIVLLLKRKSGEGNRKKEPDMKPSQPVVDNNIPTPKENLKTMIIPATSSRTMKFIPGGLEVMTGEDKGRIIRISGYPTQDGSTVTIGREPVTGPRDFAHIQFKERTISRRQAEIIYKDGKLFIKNLSETNFTCLDGREIPVNTALELKPGSLLTFGEVEMKYSV